MHGYQIVARKGASMQDVVLIPQDIADERLIDLWVRTKKSLHTQRAYRIDVGRFRAFVNKPMALVGLEDALEYAESLQGADNTKRRAINSLKSFYGFARKSGIFPVNVMEAIKAPTPKSAVSKRILPEWAVQKMIALETNPRNHCILLLLYAAGLRVSELCNLKWKDVIARAESGQIDVLGKEDKERSILLHAHAWEEIQSLKGICRESDYVFQSRQSVSRAGKLDGKRLDPATVLQIVRAAAMRAKLPDADKISPHFLRHSHGSHSIDHNAPITVVRDTMGHSSIAITNVYAHARPGQSSSTYLPI